MYENKGAEKIGIIDPAIFMKTMRLAFFEDISMICNDLARIAGDRFPNEYPSPPNRGDHLVNCTREGISLPSYCENRG
jgi:hypothetical protein